MAWYTYLYDNRMLQNVYKQNEKQHCLGGKEKDRVVLIKSLIYNKSWKRHFEGHTIKYLKKLDQSRSKM